MKPINLKSRLKKMIFRLNNNALKNQERKLTNSNNGYRSSGRWSDNMRHFNNGSENRPYYDVYVYRQHRRQGDFWDLSGGIMGI